MIQQERNETNGHPGGSPPSEAISDLQWLRLQAQMAAELGRTALHRFYLGLTSDQRLALRPSRFALLDTAGRADRYFPMTWLEGREALETCMDVRGPDQETGHWLSPLDDQARFVRQGHDDIPF